MNAKTATAAKAKRSNKPAKGKATAAKKAPAKKAPTKATATRSRREITEAHVKEAIAIRESGGTWGEVIAATGFNGALLRPHMKRAGFDPEAVAPTVTAKSDAKAIAADRKRGVSWYALAKATGRPESEVRTLAGEGGAPTTGRVFIGKPKATAKATTPAKAKKTTKAKAPAKRVESTADRRAATRAKLAKSGAKKA